MVQEISIETIAKGKKSDTLFVFGSGYSIRDLTPAEVRNMERHDTLSFSWFVHQSFIRADFHLVREVASDDYKPTIWREEFQKYAQLLKKNPYYQKTIFILHVGLGSIRALLSNSFPEGAECLFYYNCPKGTRYPNDDFRADFGGLTHGPSTLFDCINFAYLLRWRKIVLVGIDLYDRRYFWLECDQTRRNDVIRDKTYRDKHNTARETVIWAKRWRKWFQKKGMELYVHNPRSLLVQSLPIFTSGRI